LVALELQLLGASVVLGLAHIIAASHSASLQRGYRWTASARDNVVAPLTGAAGRLERASDNFSETFPLFAALAIAVVVSGKSGPLSAWGASMYFGARLAYLPLYAFGVPLVRSLVWNVSAFGIMFLAAALLWP
jgi:uncharacterized MAPEG superfamily protein